MNLHMVSMREENTVLVLHHPQAALNHQQQGPPATSRAVSATSPPAQVWLARRGGRAAPTTVPGHGDVWRGGWCPAQSLLSSGKLGCLSWSWASQRQPWACLPALGSTTWSDQHFVLTALPGMRVLGVLKDSLVLRTLLKQQRGVVLPMGCCRPCMVAKGGCREPPGHKAL